jgi:hypothetical protein
MRINYKHTPETIEKIKKAVAGKSIKYWLGKKRPEMIGNINGFKKGQSSWNKGKKCLYKEKVSEGVKKLWQDRKYRDKMIASHLLTTKGKLELHYNWKGGISFQPYPKIFNNTLKRIIKQIDNYKCQLCGVAEEEHYEKLSIHHIDYNKENCNPNNLITLCRGCNSKANYKREDWIKYFNTKINNRSRRD